MQLLIQDNPAAQKTLSKIVAKTWLDEEFKSKFLSNTNAVLEENGLTIPTGVEFRVSDHALVGILTNPVSTHAGNVVYEIPLPQKPQGLADQSLQSWTNANNSDYPVSDCDEGITF